jgi:protease-4
MTRLSFRGTGRLVGLAVAAALCGCGPASFLVTPVPASRSLEESVIVRESFWAGDKLALVEIDGVISNAREQPLLGAAGENPVSLFKEKLDKAARDSRVQAVILRINSPGGGVTASDLMYEEVRRFKEKTHKPVIAVLLDVAASGGYYVACAADRIIAHPTTVTGSIGVIMLTPDLSGTLRKLGAEMNVIKSGPLKDAGSPFREMTAADRATFQTIIDSMYERFVETVARARPALGRERVKELADGRVYLAGDAHAKGLVDDLGGMREAIEAARTAAGLGGRKLLVVQYARPLGYRPNYYAEASGAAAEVNIVNVKLPEWLSSPSPQFLYLWAPDW